MRKRYLQSPRRTLLKMAVLAALSAILTSCAEVKTGEEEKKYVYTAANIWYRDKSKIVSVNHHTGTILPFGTRVTIVSMTEHAILFADKHGSKYRLVLARKYSARDMTVKDLFKQYFTEADPFGKNGTFTRLSDSEKGSVRSGVIVVGMSKEAVLMSYGYPPSHMTPSTDDDVWKYWDHKFRARLVSFRNNRVAEVRNTR